MHWLNIRNNNLRLARSLIVFLALICVVICVNSPAVSQTSAFNQADALTLSNTSLNLTQTSKSLHALSSYSHIEKLAEQKVIPARCYRKKYTESAIILTTVGYNFNASNLSNHYVESFYATPLATPQYSISSPRGPPSKLKPSLA